MAKVSPPSRRGGRKKTLTVTAIGAEKIWVEYGAASSRNESLSRCAGPASFPNICLAHATKRSRSSALTCTAA